jgi:hypothetical protein
MTTHGNEFTTADLLSSVLTRLPEPSEQRFNQALPEPQMDQLTTTSRDDLSFTVIDPVSQIA